MNKIIDLFITFPVWVRAVLFLGIILLIWFVSAKFIYKFCSWLIVCIKYITRLFYFFIGWGIFDLLHKKVGGAFIKINIIFTGFMGMLDSLLERLAIKLKTIKSRYMKVVASMYVILILFILISSTIQNIFLDIEYGVLDFLQSL